VADDPYTDPVTGVLLNKLGLGTAAELENAEREITHAALILLGESPVHPGYDLPHLCAIHRRVFGDIYDWAGQIRTVAIAKGSLFCLPQYIETSAAEIFRALHSENFLLDLDREAFVARLAYYLGEVNAVHPFREGNGRTQRAFFEQLAREAGYTLAWQHLDAAGTSRPSPRSCAATQSLCGRCSTHSSRTGSSQHYRAASRPAKTAERLLDGRTVEQWRGIAHAASIS
jgi:cell filamentation protein